MAEILNIFDPFKLGEFLGYVRGISLQYQLNLPAGATLTLDLVPPIDRVWWWTLCSLGDTPASALLANWETVAYLPKVAPGYNNQLGTILFDEAWSNAPICPPGWRRIDTDIRFILTNVTGNPLYNVLLAQALFVHCTLFLVEAYRPFVESIESAIGEVF